MIVKQTVNELATFIAEEWLTLAALLTLALYLANGGVLMLDPDLVYGGGMPAVSV